MGTDVAVAVNGRIGGWATVQATTRSERFWVLVPPELLAQDGEDDIEVYAIQGSGPAPALARLTAS